MTDYSKYTMYYGATPAIFENAKLLRNNQTLSERKLWNYINKKQLGFKFRRQHPISTFIADFYCHELKLVIEVDGAYHLDKEQNENDRLRTKEIEEFGIKVVRFTNDQVINQINFVINSLKKKILILK